MSVYYEIEKAKLQYLELEYGIPETMLTKTWSEVRESVDGIYVIIEAMDLLDPLIISEIPMSQKETLKLVRSIKYDENATENIQTELSTKEYNEDQL